jgi:hypothetical protein
VRIHRLFGLAIFALAGCGGGTVTVTPSSTPIEDFFFATWEIDSTLDGPLSCEEAVTPTVDMDVLNVDTGSRTVFTFACNAYQGTSPAVDVGTFDVLLSLNDPAGNVVSQTEVGTENVTQSGTLDLGHHIFQIP